MEKEEGYRYINKRRMKVVIIVCVILSLLCLGLAIFAMVSPSLLPSALYYSLSLGGFALFFLFLLLPFCIYRSNLFLALSRPDVEHGVNLVEVELNSSLEEAISKIAPNGLGEAGMTYYSKNRLVTLFLKKVDEPTDLEEARKECVKSPSGNAYLVVLENVDTKANREEVLRLGKEEIDREAMFGEKIGGAYLFFALYDGKKLIYPSFGEAKHAPFYAKLSLDLMKIR